MRSPSILAALAKGAWFKNRGDESPPEGKGASDARYEIESSSRCLELANSCQRRCADGSSVDRYAALAAEPPTTQPTVNDLMQKINDLQSQVQQMKQQQQAQQQASTKLSQQEVDETVARVLQDADKHSKLLDGEGFTAGWDHGRFFLGSSDGNFLLRPSFQLQIRDGTAFRSHQQPGGGDDTQNGFEIRRPLAA